MRPLGIDRIKARRHAEDVGTANAGRTGGSWRVGRRRLLRVVVGVALVAPATLIYSTPEDAVAAPTTLVVNSTLDAADTNPGDGQCAHRREHLHAACRGPGGQRGRRPQHHRGPRRHLRPQPVRRGRGRRRHR
jgi:hypothetical protein